jgi:hypothetical protein
MNRFTGTGLPDGHALHDRLLVARAAGGDLDPEDRAVADDLLAACPDCRALARELKTLRASAAALPTARRTRDFRLSAAQAQRARGGVLERLLTPLAGPSFGFLQPLAGVVAALGLFLLVVNSVPLTMTGATGGTAPQMAAEGTDSQAGAEAPAGATPGATTAAGGTRKGSQPGYGTGLSPLASAGPTAATDKSGVSPGAAPVPTGSDGGLQGLTRDTFGSTQPSVPIGLLLGTTLVVVGLGLYVLRMYARREDPLLR